MSLRQMGLGWAMALMLGLSSGCGSQASTGTAHGEPGPRRQPIPADLKASIERSEAIGGSLYLLDKAAELATDVAIAHLGDPSAWNLGGYLPLRLDTGENRYIVLFYTRESPPRIRHQVEFVPGAKPEFKTFEPAMDMSGFVLKLVMARDATIEAKPTKNQPLNPVVMPAEAIGEQGILVYLLAGTTVPNQVVLGQHFRAIVSEQNGQVTSIMPLSKAILALPTVGEQGQRAEVLAVTHLVTEYPLETHVLANLQTQIPFVVGTSRGVWFVEQGKIQYWGKQDGGGD